MCSSSGSTGSTGPPPRPRRSSRSGKVYTEGKGSGLFFQDYTADGSAQYGFVVTSPTQDKSIQDVDRQLVTIPPDSLGGGYDARIAGPNPWTLGPLGPQAPGYLKGQSADEVDRAGVRSVGGVLHAYTDSSQSAAELVSGVKSYNSGLNIADDSRLVTTLFHELQDQGWKIGTVTSVPFCHASPAGMYAQNVERDDYQDIARAMLGLPGIIQEARQARLYPGLDVVIGTGYGIQANAREPEDPGRERRPRQPLPDRRRPGGDRRQERRQVRLRATPRQGVNGGQALRQAAAAAAHIRSPALRLLRQPRASIISPIAPPTAATTRPPAWTGRASPSPPRSTRRPSWRPSRPWPR